MTEEMKEMCEALGAFVEQTISRLEESTAREPQNLSGLGDGLRDAYDSGNMLRTVADHGVEVPVDLVDAVERLVRLTLTTQPVLLRRELDNLSAETPLDSQETAAWVSALRARAHHASLELHRGLEGVYRNAMDREVER